MTKDILRQHTQTIKQCSKCEIFHDGILKGECDCNCHKVKVGDVMMVKNKDGTIYELEVTKIKKNGLITFNILSTETKATLRGSGN